MTSCGTTDTHNERHEAPEPATTPGGESNIGDKVCWAGQSHGRKVIATHRAWLWVETHDPDQPMSVRSADCTPWVDLQRQRQRQRLIDLMLPGSGCPVGVYGASAGKLADWLLANGVTFKEETE